MLNPQYIGIDPSLRHTGICVLQEGVTTKFWEIKTEGLSVLEVGDVLRHQLDVLIGSIFRASEAWNTVFGIERQVPGSGILYHSMMVILAELANFYGLKSPQASRCMVMPLPVQLKSYMIKKLNLIVTKKSRIVEGVAKLCPTTNRLSSHKAEAYCLALMAKDVSKGVWPLNLPTKEIPLVPQNLVFGTKQNAFEGR